MAKDGNQPEAPIPTLPTSSNNFVDGNLVFIYGDFDDSIGQNVVPALIKAIDQQATLRVGVIKVFIDSNGGYARYLYDLLALIERAKAMGVIVETYVFGMAASCGSILAASGTKGFRFIGENAHHMCHLGAGGFIATSDEQLKRESEHVQHHFKNIRRLYKKYSKIKGLDKLLRTDSLFIAGEDLIKNGLADQMFHP